MKTFLQTIFVYIVMTLPLFAAAPVFTNTMSMIEMSKLTASDAASYDYFGYSVAINGDTVIVGAIYDDDGGSASGSAYLYEFNTDTQLFEQVAKLTASDAAADDEFGYSVAISGDTVIVGAYADDDDGSRSGSAYLFEKPSGGWATMHESAKLTASDAAVYDDFGFSVALSGDTVIVGAHADEDGGSYSGSAYLFEKPSGGWATMHESAKLTASDAAALDFFGRSVAISGDTVIVGVHGDDDGGNASGSAYLFEKPSGGWATMHESAKLTASDAAANDIFGHRVAISGDTIIVGAHYDDGRSGSAYLFEKPSGGWATMHESAKLTASDAAIFDEFGYSVAISGNTVIVGAHYDDDGGDRSGSVYIYKNSEKNAAILPALIILLLLD